MKSEMVDLNMLQQKVSFLISSLMLFVLPVLGTNTNIYFQCSQLNFDLSTPYELNVNSLFTSIVDSASISNFNTFEVSLPGNSQTNIVYGLFQCQGDLNSQCKDCVARSVSQLKSICPVSIGGTIQLEGCFVKYDNVSFFGVEDKTEVLKKCGPPVGSNSDVLNSVAATLANLIAGNGQYFRKGDFGSIHGVAQCVQDLSVSDCQDCLSETSGRLRSECERSSWGDMYLGKCYIHYAGNSNSTLNSDNRNGNDLRTNIIVQAMGNAIGGVVSAIVSAVVSLLISARVAESKVKPVDKKADEAKSNAYEAKSTAVEASSAAEKARLKAKKASRTSKEVRSDVNSLRSNQSVYSQNY